MEKAGSGTMEHPAVLKKNGGMLVLFTAY